MLVLDILSHYTDEEHPMGVPEILQRLQEQGIGAERKSIYDDVDTLRDMGYEIQLRRGRGGGYYMSQGTFELAELKLLVDSVASAKFITEEKSNQLIKKIEHLASKQEASMLQRQVYVSGRVKSMNKDIMENVDAIHNAIAQNLKISFQYFQWNRKKEPELRRNGERYIISPWGLSWDDENYYLVGFDSEAGIIKHYRVDKMLHITMSDEPREGKERFEKFDLAAYAKKSFGMYSGKEQKVKLYMENQLAGVIVDRFGKDVMMRPVDKTHFTALVDVAVSRQFIHWVFALGDGAKIVGPEEVVKFAQEEIRRLQEEYLKSVGEYYEQKENN